MMQAERLLRKSEPMEELMVPLHVPPSPVGCPAEELV